jgi:hypothetical protein
LFLANETEAWLVEGAWSGTPRRTALTLGNPPLAGHSFFEVDSVKFGTYYPALKTQVWPHLPESAVSGQANAVLGQSLGYNAHGFWGIWDITGAAAVFQALGMPYRNRDTGEVFSLSPENFNANWKLQGDWLACHPMLYDQLDMMLTKAAA